MLSQNLHDIFYLDLDFSAPLYMNPPHFKSLITFVRPFYSFIYTHTISKKSLILFNHVALFFLHLWFHITSTMPICLFFIGSFKHTAAHLKHLYTVTTYETLFSFLVFNKRSLSILYNHNFSLIICFHRKTCIKTQLPAGSPCKQHL